MANVGNGCSKSLKHLHTVISYGRNGLWIWQQIPLGRRIPLGVVVVVVGYQRAIEEQDADYLMRFYLQGRASAEKPRFRVSDMRPSGIYLFMLHLMGP